MSPDDPVEIGDGVEIGAYRIERRIGEGGMGVVYRALDLRLQRLVAIKVLGARTGDEDARLRFRREAQTASSLNHPHILIVHDVGATGGRDYLVTEFVDGGTLSDWARDAPRAWREIVELLTGVADALAAAHDAGIVHRDIKPANILVTRAGYAKLADFGLAKLRDAGGPQSRVDTVISPHTRPGLVVGTIAYMSPEQAWGRAVDARSDIFSFAVMLAELIEGRRPFEGVTELEILQRIRHEAPSAFSNRVPPALAGILRKALEKEPEARYQSMREMLADLRHLLEDGAPRRSLPAWSWRRSAAVVAAAVAVAGVSAWVVWPRSTTREIRSIAVLPLRNLSGDAAQDYFSDGTTEQLISNLSRIRALKVISRTSVMRYKGTTKTVPEIGRDLAVDAVLEGSVQRVGDRVRIDARLVDAATDATLWTQDFDRELADVLALEGEVARSIVGAIRLPLTTDERSRLGGRRILPEAWDAYLHGRALSWNFNDQDQLESIRYFQEAVRLQPNFAAAHAGVAVGCEGRFVLGFSRSPETVMCARDAAAKALELDPDLPDAHVYMADVLSNIDWNWAAAEREFKKGLDLDPNFPDALNDYGYFLIVQGRLNEALAASQRAVALDPFSSGIYITQGLVLRGLQRYGEAADRFRTAVELDPSSVTAAGNLIQMTAMRGDLPSALESLQRLVASQGGDIMRVAAAGNLFARLGRASDARRVLANLTSPSARAAVLLPLGDREGALKELEGGVTGHRLPLLLKTDPTFGALHNEPRFQQVLRGMGLPPG